MCQTLFQHPDSIVSHCYVRSLGPLLCSHLLHATSHQPLDLQEISMAVTAVEVLVSLTPAEHSEYDDLRFKCSVYITV